MVNMLKIALFCCLLISEPLYGAQTDSSYAIKFLDNIEDNEAWEHVEGQPPYTLHENYLSNISHFWKSKISGSVIFGRINYLNKDSLEEYINHYIKDNYSRPGKQYKVKVLEPSDIKDSAHIVQFRELHFLDTDSKEIISFKQQDDWVAVTVLSAESNKALKETWPDFRRIISETPLKVEKFNQPKLGVQQKEKSEQLVEELKDFEKQSLMPVTFIEKDIIRFKEGCVKGPIRIGDKVNTSKICDCIVNRLASNVTVAEFSVIAEKFSGEPLDKVFGKGSRFTRLLNLSYMTCIRKINRQKNSNQNL